MGKNKADVQACKDLELDIADQENLLAGLKEELKRKQDQLANSEDTINKLNDDIQGLTIVLEMGRKPKPIGFIQIGSDAAFSPTEMMSVPYAITPPTSATEKS